MEEEAVKERYSPVRYLEALLSAEIEEREHNASHGAFSKRKCRE